MGEKFLTIDETAKKLGLTYKTVFRYIHDKEPNKRLKATKVGYWRIKEEDLEEFMRQHSNVHKRK